MKPEAANDIIKKDSFNPARFFAMAEETAREKRIDVKSILEAIREPIVIAIKKDMPGVTDADVEIEYYIPQVRDHDSDAKKDREYKKAKFDIFVVKTIVDEVANPNLEISVDDELAKGQDVGGKVRVQVDTFGFMRTSTNSAKQRMRQKMRDTKKARLSRKWKDIIGTVKTADVTDTFDNGDVRVELVDRNEKFDLTLFAADRVPGEIINEGDRIQVFVAGIHEVEREVFLKITRTHKDLVRILLEREIPEIQMGDVEVMSVSRMCGIRTKIAVRSNDDNVEAVGACLGEKGRRLEKVLYSIRGRRPNDTKSEDSEFAAPRKEEIDIILYKDDPAEYIKEALKPAQIKEINVTSETTAEVIVTDENMTPAIGAKGNNAKLAAQLTGYVLDIIPETGIYKPKPGEFDDVDNAETETDNTDNTDNTDTPETETAE
ncbi:MAG: hypothetical protein LBN42_03085 [Oscillospiraceae bacterium]|jgi:N utilization substance protein A|nr:hypothetical protein [Oscillospiraceae bacterium]